MKGNELKELISIGDVIIVGMGEQAGIGKIVGLFGDVIKIDPYEDAQTKEIGKPLVFTLIADVQKLDMFYIIKPKEENDAESKFASLGTGAYKESEGTKEVKS